MFAARPKAFELDSDQTRPENAEQAYHVVMSPDGASAHLDIIVKYPYALEDLAGLNNTPEKRSMIVYQMHWQFAKNVVPVSYNPHIALHYSTDIIFHDKRMDVEPAHIALYKNNFDIVPCKFSQFERQMDAEDSLFQMAYFTLESLKRNPRHEKRVEDFGLAGSCCHEMTKTMQEAIAKDANNKKVILALLKNNKLVATVPHTTDHPAFSEPDYSDLAFFNAIQLITAAQKKPLYNKNQAAHIVPKLNPKK